MASRLGQFCISVTNLEQAEDFYTNVCGLEVQERIEIPDAKELVLGSEGSDAKIQLAQKTAQDGPINHGDEALWKFYVWTDDIEGVFQHAGDFEGAQQGMAPLKLEEWPVTVAFIIDPDGYRIELVQDN
jgi:lactoylglutathione lyase